MTPDVNSALAQVFNQLRELAVSVGKLEVTAGHQKDALEKLSESQKTFHEKVTRHFVECVNKPRPRPPLVSEKTIRIVLIALVGVLATWLGVTIPMV